MTSAFDPRAAASRYVHDEACGREHPFDPADCHIAAERADELIGRLRAAGLALVPIVAVDWLGRAFDELVERRPAPEEASQAPWYFQSLHLRQVRVRRRLRDGRVVRGELVPHYLAVVELTALNHEHDDDIVSAIIEDEAAWIAGLLDARAEGGDEGRTAA